MSFNPIKTVALVDWSWIGHHPTYFVNFALAMARACARVVPFCSEPEDFNSRLALEPLEPEMRLRIKPPVLISGPVASKFRPARWRGHYDAWRFFVGLGRQLLSWEGANGTKIDLVFFACIYDRQFANFHKASRFFPFPCSGLYLHARSFRMPGSPLSYFGILPCPEKIFTTLAMRSVGILDEGIQAEMSKVSGGKPVYVFPDITDESLPGGDYPEGLGGKLKALAAGRPIVSLSGHLQWTKGIDIFTNVAKDSAAREIFFFLGGDVMWRDISHELRSELEAAWEGLPNLYVYLKHLPEKTMNSVIAVSDVVVAAYRDFPNSSNTLTKAAIFERPIVVSDGYLMAERVKKYGLGEVVPEGDAEALVGAIQKMVQPGYYESLREHARWAEYREAHSVARLDMVFKEMFSV